MAINIKPEGAWRRREHGTRVLLAAAACWFAWQDSAARAQGSGADYATPAAQSMPATPAAPPENRDFANVLGQWMQQGVSTVGAGLGAVVGALGGQANKNARGAADAASTVAQGAADAAKGAADAARDTATTVSRLPSSSVLGGRERCALAPNGAPDCVVAADAICRAKGFSRGTSVDFETSEKCPPSYRTTSRNVSSEGVCTLEHFVTRALCQ